MGISDGTIVDIENSGLLPTPNAPWNVVISRFDNTLAMADDMMELLVGPDGDAGYLGTMNSLITSAPVTAITAPTVDTSASLTSVGTAPVFDKSDLVAFPTAVYADPDLTALPTIDLSLVQPPAKPDEVNPTVTWSETALSADIYTDLLARMLSDLQSGATGLDATVEAAIYARGQQRQQVSNLKAYNQLNNDLVSRGFQLPSGALLSALTELSSEILRQETEINNQIMISQGELAQKNSQFIIQQAVVLEGLIRQTKDNIDQRKLDYAKAVSDLIVRNYSEKVRAYVAEMEANRAYVEVQVENLKAVVESNKANVDLYKEKYSALAVRIDATAKNNSSLAEIYNAEMQGFSESARAISTTNTVLIEHIKAKVEAADLELRASIASAAHSIEGYSSENALKQKVSADMANIAAQTIASTLNAVNASASLGYSGQESKSESWSHGDDLTETHSFSHNTVG